MAPIAPFFTDWLYQNLNGVTQQEPHESVHLAFFPKAEQAAIDTALEQRMSYAQRITSLVLSLRKKEAIRVRQPLQKILLPVLSQDFQNQVESVENLLLSELNIKEIEYVSDASGIVKKGIKPNFKVLGKRLGKNMKAGKAAIEAFTQEDIAQLERAGKYNLDLDGEAFELGLSDVTITSEDIEGWLVASDAEITVALDATITPALEAEGMARELVNRIQNLRKDQDLDVTDRIRLKIQQHQAINQAVLQFEDYISQEVLATQLDVVDESFNGHEVALIDDVVVQIAVEKQ
jgi:isoleucyl-tRNA synthetase